MVSYFDVLFLYMRINNHLVINQMDTEGVVWKSLDGL